MSARPQVSYLTSTSSASSYSSSDSDLSSTSSVRHSMDSTQPIVSVEVLRCLRCARAEEITSTDDPSSMGMVQIGTNIYYCNRCAKMTGYNIAATTLDLFSGFLDINSKFHVASRSNSGRF
ncbi:hypothetical protein B0T13DRAFT_510200 [Neurospora crassa]|nr:hypothetical protein B0T13DRAFT_510200 [Neurospora crassa]